MMPSRSGQGARGRAGFCVRRRTARPGVGRSGFALLAVLWVMVGAAALTLAMSIAAREAIAAGHNRIHLAIAGWAAEDCAERARAVIAATLAADAARTGGAPGTWRALDHRVAGAGLLAVSHCRVELRPAGTTLNLNTADDGQLHRLLASVGVGRARADSLVDALLDWRDPDPLPRPFGAEFPVYEAAGLAAPRNGPLADPRELRRVRGWHGLMTAVEGLVGVEADRICLQHAPPAVLATLPGVGPEVLARIAEHRSHGLAIPDLATLAAQVSAPARDSLLAHYPALMAAATPEPDAWFLVARAAAGDPAVEVVLELRLVHAGPRAAVVRRRRWVS